MANGHDLGFVSSASEPNQDDLHLGISKRPVGWTIISALYICTPCT
jgi:hypothetical protein